MALQTVSNLSQLKPGVAVYTSPVRSATYVYEGVSAAAAKRGPFGPGLYLGKVRRLLQGPYGLGLAIIELDYAAPRYVLPSEIGLDISAAGAPTTQTPVSDMDKAQLANAVAAQDRALYSRLKMAETLLAQRSKVSGWTPAVSNDAYVSRLTPLVQRYTQRQQELQEGLLDKVQRVSTEYANKVLSFFNLPSIGALPALLIPIGIIALAASVLLAGAKLQDMLGQSQSDNAEAVKAVADLAADLPPEMRAAVAQQLAPRIANVNPSTPAGGFLSEVKNIILGVGLGVVAWKVLPPLLNKKGGSRG